MCFYCYLVPKYCPTLCDPMDCSMPGSTLFFTIFQSLLKLMSIESLIPSNHIVVCNPLPFPVSSTLISLCLYVRTIPGRNSPLPKLSLPVSAQ